ncbi:F-box domain-containing protein [Mycena kentingensis (nom. inval.)]|nr:F-box domain-containing protein [Mycena kentingensis (nom. inval.)]
MTGHHIPDEILSEILSPALKVSDDAFSNASSWTFATYEESTSAYLLVNSSWLRVSTPLLYHTVVLRSKAQAIALGRALQQNKDLGRFVKRLRVEGGFGPSMKTILGLTPNVVDLFLSLGIYSNDSTGGLCGGLALISPTTLILSSTSWTRNKAVNALMDALVAAIPGWDRLTTVDSSFSGWHGGPDRLLAAIKQANRLERLVVPMVHTAMSIYPQVQSCPIRVVECKARNSHYVELNISESLKPLIKYREPKTGFVEPSPAKRVAIDIPPSLDPFFQPLKDAAATVRETVWSRILYFAMECPERAERAKTFDTDKKSNVKDGARISLLLVSKLFLKLGLPHFYAHLFFRYSYLTDHFKNSLSRARFTEQPVQTIASNSLLAISTFPQIATAFGTTLVHAHMHFATENQAQISAVVFSHLTALKRLRWSGRVEVDLSQGLGANSNAMPRLEELRLRSVSQSFVTLFSQLQFPRIRSLEIDGRFHSAGSINFVPLVQAHGALLQHLSVPAETSDALGSTFLTICNSLTSLEITPTHSGVEERRPMSLASLSPHKGAMSLTRIVVNQYTWPSKKSRAVAAAAEWTTLFARWTPTTSFPNLREISFKCFTWPKTERDIAKSCWVPLAETLLKNGIDLLDKDGKKWRARLKVSAAR